MTAATGQAGGAHRGLQCWGLDNAKALVTLQVSEVMALERRPVPASGHQLGKTDPWGSPGGQKPTLVSEKHHLPQTNRQCGSRPHPEASWLHCKVAGSLGRVR